MNTIFLRKSVFWLPSIAALAVLSSGLSASAQTVDKVSSQPLTDPSATVASANEFSPELDTASQNFSTETTETFTVTNLTKVQQLPNTAIQENASVTPTPIPGTVATSSATLTSEFVQPTSQTTSQPTSQPSAPRVAQSDIDLGRTTRGGSSYVGVAANIGLNGGDSSLGDGNFAVVSKIGLTNSISVRPSAVFGDNTTVLVPITYDFTFKSADAFSEPLPIAPYVGVGAAYKTGDDSKFAFLASAGVDVPLTPQFTATAAINAGFFDQTDIGLLLGVGYNFSGL
ncbi:outer membrane protein [Nostoc sp.]|uniref:outer membrane protein n=1 Tax=Nostoc sp. TaxID=1180 RepID=UPI002FF51EDC